jgi:hypothetical protein
MKPIAAIQVHRKIFEPPRRMLLFLLLLMSAGCAKIADPIPPVLLVPKAAVDLTVRQRADAVILRVSAPRENTNGSPVATLKRVEVYRLSDDASPSSDSGQIPTDQFQQRADPILSIPETRLSDFGNKDFLTFEDSFPNMEPSFRYEHAFRYAVLFVNNKNQAAGFSNQAVIAPAAIPLPPPGLEAEVRQDAILLRWAVPTENMDGSKPPRIYGYNIYRASEPGVSTPLPMNPTPLQKTEFKDVHFQFDKTYYYRVSVVGIFGDPSAESALSKALAVTARDVFPPQPVGNFNAVADNGSVILLWKPSPSADVSGYRISRKEKETGTSRILQKDLIVAYSYRDAEVLPGGTYVYTITALDAHGNESSGATAEIAVP